MGASGMPSAGGGVLVALMLLATVLPEGHAFGGSKSIGVVHSGDKAPARVTAGKPHFEPYDGPKCSILIRHKPGAPKWIPLNLYEIMLFSGSQYITASSANMSSTWKEYYYHPIERCFDLDTSANKADMCHTGNNPDDFDQDPRLQAYYPCGCGSKVLTNVTLWNRQDCCSERSQNFVVDFLDSTGAVVQTIPIDGDKKTYSLLPTLPTPPACPPPSPPPPPPPPAPGPCAILIRHKPDANFSILLNLYEIKLWVGGQYIKPKDAYMSSTWYESPLYHPIKYCFDNITTTSREAMCHTGYNSTYYDPNPRLWAFYDCPSTHTILTSVQLWNRQDCCDDRMQTFEVAFLDGFGKEDLVLPLTGTPKIWTLNTGI